MMCRYRQKLVFFLGLGGKVDSWRWEDEKKDDWWKWTCKQELQKVRETASSSGWQVHFSNCVHDPRVGFAGQKDRSLWWPLTWMIMMTVAHLPITYVPGTVLGTLHIFFPHRTGLAYGCHTNIQKYGRTPSFFLLEADTTDGDCYSNVRRWLKRCCLAVVKKDCPLTASCSCHVWPLCAPVPILQAWKL